jgi:hypothetical protein
MRVFKAFKTKNKDKKKNESAEIRTQDLHRVKAETYDVSL